MTRSPQPAPPAMPSPVTGMAAGTALLLQQADTLLRVQERMLAGFEAYARVWIARRRDDIRAGFHALDEIRATEDPQQRTRLLNGWMLGCLGRLRDDIDDFSEQAGRLSRGLELDAATSSTDAGPLTGKAPERARAAALTAAH